MFSEKKLNVEKLNLLICALKATYETKKMFVKVNEVAGVGWLAKNRGLYEIIHFEVRQLDAFFERTIIILSLSVTKIPGNLHYS